MLIAALSVTSKIIFEGDTGPNQINIDDVPLDTLMRLFGEIFKASGIDEEAAKLRDQQKKVPSLKPSPDSV